MPVRRMLVMASAAVMWGSRATNSVVIMLPALSSGYFKSSLMLLRISGSAWARIRRTTLAGISSTRSTASSMYSSLSTPLSSVSEKLLISASCMSGSISTKVSAANSFGISRNSMAGAFSGKAASRSATWAGCMVESTSLRVLYFFSSHSFSTVVWNAVLISDIVPSLRNQFCRPGKARENDLMRRAVWTLPPSFFVRRPCPRWCCQCP